MLDLLAGWIVPFNRNPWSSIRCKAVRLWSAWAAERATRLLDAALADYSAPGATLHLPSVPLSRPFFPCARTLRRHIG